MGRSRLLARALRRPTAWAPPRLAAPCSSTPRRTRSSRPRASWRAIGATTLQADLTTNEGIAAVREAIGEEQGGVVTCFQTLAHLESFVACVDLLVELGAAHTVVLSVPNDAFWSIENPYHPTMWGAGAFEELRSLVPGDHVVLEQVALAGLGDRAARRRRARARARAPARPSACPAHFLLAFGPQADRLAPVAAARMADAAEERRWERERTSELAFMAARLQELESAS